MNFDGRTLYKWSVKQIFPGKDTTKVRMLNLAASLSNQQFCLRIIHTRFHHFWKYNTKLFSVPENYQLQLQFLQRDKLYLLIA